MKIEFEQILDPSNVEVEDSGMAKITDFTSDDGQEDGVFVRLHSWSEEAIHTEFDALVGKKVRITIETV